MTNTPTKKRTSTVLPRSTVDYLKNWMMSPEHIAHPYPTEKEKAEIMAATDIELKQLTNWFVNNRKRFWKPRVEARLQQQLQAQTTAVSMASQSQSIESKFCFLFIRFHNYWWALSNFLIIFCVLQQALSFKLSWQVSHLLSTGPVSMLRSLLFKRELLILTRHRSR